MALLYDSTPVVYTISSGDQGVDGIISGYKWNGIVTYSNPNSIYDYDNSSPLINYGDDLNGFNQAGASILNTVYYLLEDDYSSERPALSSQSVSGFTWLSTDNYINYRPPYRPDITTPNDGIATIRIARNLEETSSVSYGPGDGIRNGDIFLGSEIGSPRLGDKSYFAILRELGGALGLKAAGESGPYGFLPSAVDSIEYTVMASHSYVGAPDASFAVEARGFARTFMMYDIAALQHLYGANYSTNAGNTVYTWNATSGTSYIQNDGDAERLSMLRNEDSAPTSSYKIFQTIWDGGGNDTYDLSNYSTNLTLSLDPGDHSKFSTTQLARLGGTASNPILARGNVFNALLFQDDHRSLIENAIGGTGNDRISGNLAENNLLGGAGLDTLRGMAGDDTLDGGTGNDVMDGGAGDDLYFVRNVGDIASEGTDGGGTDTVISTVSYSLGAGLEVLQLRGDSAVTGTGNELANEIIADFDAPSRNTLVGGGGDDKLVSHHSADVLDGGAGVDSMEGGPGDDVYYVDDAADACEEKLGGGTDTVWASVSYRLAAHLDRLNLTGLAVEGHGNELVNYITGNASANALYGYAGNDRLTGGAGNDTLDGGDGADRMTGGDGDDTYIVNTSSDNLIETTSGGSDTVISSVNLTLISNFEHLTLSGSASNGGGNGANNVLTGNASSNTLTGGSGADTLLGAAGDDRLDGGTGADRMEGGTGNDVYAVDTTSDVLVEAASAGADTVEAAINFSLGANFENLLLTGTATSGTGNGVANRLTGNASANTLVGLGGADTLDGGGGADRMEGGGGRDTYVVDNASDLVVETDAGGGDTVLANRSYTLPVLVENLTLTGSAITGTGNSMNNSISGNSGANTLAGIDGADRLFGGGGIDTLIGGLGNDVFAFGATSESSRSARDVIRAGNGAVAFEGAGAATGDTIDLSAIDADTETAGDQAFVFGTAKGKGSLWVVESGDVTHLRGNTDSDTDFEFALEIHDQTVRASAYVAGDFVL
ncbi:M10 family metallopeptidase C-terminal domain-containing protein [Amaricoccus solimangrovi]|uniref:Peptidase M10 serralysin C-terminal domain-containing protein n=1 Tax=Amaricoccus solimangrovi TaxID=2589815 RepID=A0A501WGE7_9RHOB|nr:M10 family metallopeptidase C-terminal domain-containing protein [Amaricoccus solimangrovi]TPE47872.1 hypothetical protein FJM51_19235 [Amaricoccus solimangrovi]